MTGRDRRKPLLICATALILVLAVDRMLFSPALAHWRDRQQQIEALRIQLAHADNLLDQETRWLRRRQDMQQRLLPADKSGSEDQLLGLVDKWASSAGIQVTGLRPLWKQTRDQQALLEMQITGVGDIVATCRFLYAVESSAVAIAVDYFELTAQVNDGRKLALNLRISALPQSSIIGRNP